MIPVHHTIIMAADQEDAAHYMNTVAFQGAPVIVLDPTILRPLDLSSKAYTLIKTEGYWRRADLEECENILLAIKAANFKGIVHFVDVLGVLTPCMSFELCASSSPDDWPADVPTSHGACTKLTTIHGRTYTIFSGSVRIIGFREKLFTLAMTDPVLYTGGFA